MPANHNASAQTTTAIATSDDVLAQGIAQLRLKLSAQQQRQLRQHLQLLVKWNRALNLTALPPEQMITRHTLDSLTIASFVRGDSVLDIGSGGGFPGVPLAIAQPHRRFTLLDSRTKRAEFLRAARTELALNNVEVVESRVENYRSARKFSTLTARALASLTQTLHLTAALHHRDARLLAMKGRATTANAEIAQIDPNARARLDLQNIRLQKLQVPFLPAERHVIIVKLGNAKQNAKEMKKRGLPNC